MHMGAKNKAAFFGKAFDMSRFDVVKNEVGF